MAVAEPRRQALRRAVAVAVGQLGLAHAGRAGADEHADTRRAVALAQICSSRSEPVLMQRFQQQPGDAAIPGRMFIRQWAIQVPHFAQPALQRARFEAAVAQTGCVVAQRLEQCGLAAAAGGGHGVMADGQRVHQERSSAQYG